MTHTEIEKTNQVIQRFYSSRNNDERNQIINEVIEYLNEELDKKNIEMLIDGVLPHSSYCNNYHSLYEKILEYAEKLHDANLLLKVYLSLNLNNEKNIELIKDGIEKLKSLKEFNNAGELYVKLASEIKQKLYCDEALRLLDKSNKKYAFSISLYKYLSKKEKLDVIVYYNTFCTQVKSSSKKTSLSFTSLYSLMSCYITKPLSFDLPVMCGYNYITAMRKFYEKSITIIDEALKVGQAVKEDDEGLEYISDNITVQTEIGEFKGCHVFSYVLKGSNGWKIENYYAPNVGLIRIVVIENDTLLYAFEICNYTVKGGEGLFPLCIGNKWSYKQTLCPEWAGQIIEREIVSESGEFYNIAGFDFTYLKPEEYATTDVETLFYIADNTNMDNANRIFDILLKRNERPWILEIASQRLKFNNEFFNHHKIKGYRGEFAYLKANSLSIDGNYIEEETNRKSLYYRYLNISHAASYNDMAVNVFRQVSFINQKLYDTEWKPGFKKEYTVKRQKEDSSKILLETALYSSSTPSYDEWIKNNEKNGEVVTLSAKVIVTDAGTIDVKSGIFNNCIKVQITCPKPEGANYFGVEQHLLQETAFDICGEKNIYYAPNVGIIKAEYNWDGLEFIVELSEYNVTPCIGNYMPIASGNYWRYELIPEKISLKYTALSVEEREELMLFEEYNKINVLDF